MSKGCVRVFRVRIGRCLVGAPSMLTSQWSPSARMARQWRRAPIDQWTGRGVTCRVGLENLMRRLARSWLGMRH
jgi:hypothetical protein